jgi:hypothetical protein
VRLANQENWADAIAKARQIPPGRALYAQAQEKINVWQTQINAQENLQEAYRLASSNEADGLLQAITLASQIPIAIDRLVRTEKLTPSPYQGEGWGGVNCPNSNGDCYNYTSVAKAGQEAISKWSEQLLTLAQETADYDLTEAIAIANSIPRNSSVYNSARTYVEIWRKKQSRSPLDFSDL